MPDQATDPVTRGQRLRQPGAPGASRTAPPVFADEGRLDYVVKRNPARPRLIEIPGWRWRRTGKSCVPGARRQTQAVSIHDDNKTEYVVQRVMRLVERTADRDGQLLLEPDYELEGQEQPDEAPGRDRATGDATHEQFQRDQDRSRPGALPSGKFATRLQRRLRTVLQELVHRAAPDSQGTADHPDWAGYRAHDGAQDAAEPTALSTRNATLTVNRRHSIHKQFQATRDRQICRARGWKGTQNGRQKRSARWVLQ